MTVHFLFQNKFDKKRKRKMPKISLFDLLLNLFTMNPVSVAFAKHSGYNMPLVSSSKSGHLGMMSLHDLHRTFIVKTVHQETASL